MSNTSSTEVTIEKLIKENDLLKQEIEELKAKLLWFEKQFCLNQQKMNERPSKKTNLKEGEQLNFFNETERKSNAEAAEPAKKKIPYQHR